MDWFVTGAALGLAVSVPPGANTMMCVVRGRRGFLNGLPSIIAAAAADCVYALLAGAGLLAAGLAGASDILSISAVGFLLLCAYLLWPRQTVPTGRSAAMVAAFNPPAALLWLALSGSLNTHPRQAVTVVVFACGAATATATWFTGVAFASDKLSHVLSDSAIYRVSVAVSVALVCLAAIRLVTLI